jgi:NADH dehydrogenase/NADH:ubiquinone oxidoreductase subunit G
MAFISVNIIGNGALATAVENPPSLEAVVNSLVAVNTNAADSVFSLFINDAEVTRDTVAANATFRIPDKLNIPANSVLKVSAAVGVYVTVSYFQQAVDEAAALSTIQQQATIAKTQSDLAVNRAAAALVSQDAAHVSETNAATSERNASTSEQNASTSERNAATSERNAHDSELASAKTAKDSADSATASADSAAAALESEIRTAGSVANLTNGIINDSTVSTVDTWSSAGINRAVSKLKMQVMLELL